MSEHLIKNIVIVGGGTSGWMTAAALGTLLRQEGMNIRLIESSDIANVGVGEATIPQLKLFNDLLGLDEDDFVRKTQATFKHGIEFVNWKKLDHSYMHPFGTLGLNFEGVEFHQFWLKMAKLGKASNLQDYSFNSVAAKSGKMMRSIDTPNSPLNNIAYAFHFDASLYVKYLREIAEKHGVKRTDAKVTEVKLRKEDGFIESLLLDNGEVVEGELFIDCSGFRGILIEQALHTGYEDWSHWLPCDRAVAVQSKTTEAPIPYTRSTAQKAGWQWRIPLQHRVGNGHVYSSKFMSDEEAEQILLEGIDGEPLTAPRIIRFKTGMRRKFWNKNCVAIGLAGGFIEPLESTAIHLVQSGISRLMSLFPSKQFFKSDIDTYNQQAALEMERIRDFIILHYKVTERDDTPFWDYVRNMEIPEYLQRKIDLFKANGRIFREDEELFNQTSWLSVMVGQGIVPDGYHPMVDVLSEEQIKKRMDNVKSVIEKSVDYMPSQAQFIAQHCAATSMDANSNND
ncbi:MULTISPECIES: tryptophan halogenase family protein [Alteromonadaceae]|uniref:tryptophan halogenase family protein n=1 Tax=Alteromonadaceae TaxID=72275 RepID=UPI001C08EDD5|nr:MULTISPECIES: tryptophan halogenase family protein [Aliiglaciecola]MBU2879129.1 tryptophan 7-halogenase [Aliiglaciecola lipolytica]MDO6710827.1 tryptophan 7-halogenase [Aliiglaciecola sp. 2_MG-2023]MDO6751765.1 tryptophan 7-halogenase [Aliiglaciecola sp. 1_MG-2023]